jgi:hypothetical protein
VQDDLGVGVRGEPVAAPDQFAAELGEVVGLTGVDDGHRAAGRLDAHRLTAAGQVDDGQPAVTERGVLGEPGAGVVRAPARHRLGHRVHGFPLTAQIALERDPSRDSAHQASSVSSPTSGGTPRSPSITVCHMY